MIWISLLINILLISGCQNRNARFAEAYQVENENQQILYDLNQPDQIFELPDELEEVSGLSFFNKNQLLCIQDEDGKLFIFDTKLKNVIYEEKFAKDDDYEGVTLVKDQAIVINSKGNFYRFKIERNPKAEYQKTDFTGENDVEGLAYLPSSDFLLIALKEKAEISKEQSFDGKAVYAYSLAENKLLPDPFMVIKNQEIKNQLRDQGYSLLKHFPFKPSALAIHPINRDIYVLGSVGKLLVIVNQQGAIRKIVPLPPKYFRQPEGITFDPNGDMYISNEADGRTPNILHFKYQNN